MESRRLLRSPRKTASSVTPSGNDPSRAGARKWNTLPWLARRLPDVRPRKDWTLPQRSSREGGWQLALQANPELCTCLCALPVPCPCSHDLGSKVKTQGSEGKTVFLTQPGQRPEEMRDYRGLTISKWVIVAKNMPEGTWLAAPRGLLFASRWPSGCCTAKS